MQTKTLLLAAFAALSAASPLVARQQDNAAPGGPGGPAPSGGDKPAPTSTEIAPNVSPSAGTIAKLLEADNTVARFNTFRAELDAGNVALKFDLRPEANPAVTPGEGGQVDLAQRGNFPLLTTLGISAAGIFFEPCGLNTPHVHPRATEMFTVATDSEIFSGFILENGNTAEFNTTLKQYQTTAFPMGSIHYQQNQGCEKAVAIAGLNHEDPGASSLAQNYIINSNGDIVLASLGFPDQIKADNFKAFKDAIPTSLAKGVEECLIRCKIEY